HVARSIWRMPASRSPVMGRFPASRASSSASAGVKCPNVSSAASPAAAPAFSAPRRVTVCCAWLATSSLLLHACAWTGLSPKERPAIDLNHLPSDKASVGRGEIHHQRGYVVWRARAAHQRLADQPLAPLLRHARAKEFGVCHIAGR